LHPLVLIDKLRGGDRRSLGESAEVVAAVAKTPALFADLFECLFDDDPVVRMRAADAVEKVTRESPQLLQPWKRPLLETVAARREKEVRWHVAQLLPRLQFTPAERETAVAILTGYLTDESSIVKTFSMQALADLAEQDKSLLDQVVPLIERLGKTGTPAMRSRGRRILARRSGGR
jgi:HEAT repeat protein